MDLRWNVRTGWPSQVTLKRRISAYARRDRISRYKVGITNNPETRKNGYGDSYDEMVVLYETSTVRHAQRMETSLVEYYRDDCDNAIGGGGGRIGHPPHYLYIVLKKRRKRRD